MMKTPHQLTKPLRHEAKEMSPWQIYTLEIPVYYRKAERVRFALPAIDEFRYQKGPRFVR